MKNLNIKEIRKELNLTQSEFAKKLGVSRQTVVNYENGLTIPESKKDLLYNILQNEGIAKEPDLQYNNSSGYDIKINQLQEEIAARKNIIKDSTDQELIQHQTKMIELIKLQIHEIEKAQKLHLQK